ncbi:MAG: DUF397 domain-containing protein [Nocardia sp.]|nr:DUF397 domain-containing protein [Nocardia sp.]
MNVNHAGAKWFKSSHSQGASECVEVAWLAGGSVGVRDSKNPAGAALIFGADEWADFTRSIRDDRFVP